MGFITRIKSKSPETKALYGFWFAALITGGIALVWFTTVPARFSDVSTNKSFDMEEIKEVFDVTKSQVANTIDANGNESEELDGSGNEDMISRLNQLQRQVANDDSVPVATSSETKAEEATSTEAVVVESAPEAEDKTVTTTPEVAPPKVILIGTTTVPKTE